MRKQLTNNILQEIIQPFKKEVPI